MIPDLDIYRSAQVLVKHHGQDAPIQAAMIGLRRTEPPRKAQKRLI